MLDDNDRRRLREIERHLCAEDPALAWRFETAAACSSPLRGPTHRKAEARPFSRLLGLMLALFGVSLLIAPPEASVLLFIAAMCLLLARWLCTQQYR